MHNELAIKGISVQVFAITPQNDVITIMFISWNEVFLYTNPNATIARLTPIKSELRVIVNRSIYSHMSFFYAQPTEFHP